MNFDDLPEEEQYSRAAYHEGGHAVCAHLHGMTIIGVSVDPDNASPLTHVKWPTKAKDDSEHLDRFRAEVAYSAAGVLAEHYMFDSDVVWFPTPEDIGPCPPTAEAAQDWSQVAQTAHLLVGSGIATRATVNQLTKEGVAIAHQHYHDPHFRAAVSRVADLLLDDADGLGMDQAVPGAKIVAAIEAAQ